MIDVYFFSFPDDITMVPAILIGVFVALAVILLSTIFNRNRIKKD